MSLELNPKREVNRYTTRNIRFNSNQPVEHLNRLIRLFSVSLVLSYFSPVCGQNVSLAGSNLDPNHVILSLLTSMPIGGGYSATAAATRELQSAVQTRGGILRVNPSLARTTYCSAATYLVFVRAIQSLLPPSAFAGGLAEALAVKGQPDGVGVWGRWNANGPGTACLFYELGVGHNFTSFEAARRGDFMKIFWTNEVGNRKHRYSVIYLEADK